MSSFKAYNIDYDDVSEPEADDTKELQIEEALKLYQTALKYHCEGPKSFDKAQEAYAKLFESEIFKYAESQSELQRSELLAANQEWDVIWHDAFEIVPSNQAAQTEGAPNSLPQIIHLAYKNHGLFVLDSLKHKIGECVAQLPEDRFDPKPIQESARKALSNFLEAVDKDDADLDLWKISATVASMVGCTRIARFCLEAVLDGDPDGLDDILGPGLEERLAKQLLDELVGSLKDDLSTYMQPHGDYGRRRVSLAMRKALDPYSALPRPASDAVYSLQTHLGKSPTKYNIKLGGRSWAAIGNTIVQQYFLEQGGYVDVGPGVGVGFRLPILPLVEEQRSGRSGQITGQTVEESSSKTQESSHPSPDKSQTVPPSKPDEIPNGSATNEEDRKPANPSQGKPDSEKQQSDSHLSRKRSSDSAGLTETPEGVRGRSKRLRARVTLDGANIEAALVEAQETEDQMQSFTEADDALFETIDGIFEKLGVQPFGSQESLRQLLKDQSETAVNTGGLETAFRDLYEIAKTCNAAKIKSFSAPDDWESWGDTSRSVGISTVLGYDQSGGSNKSDWPVLGLEQDLVPWVEKINAMWASNNEAAYLWLAALTRPDTSTAAKAYSATYHTHRWPDELKRVVLQVVLKANEYFYCWAKNVGKLLDERRMQVIVKGKTFRPTPDERADVEMIQTLFELHLDLLASMRSPDSGMSLELQEAQSRRLENWAAIANEVVTLLGEDLGSAGLDERALRHVWATVCHLSMCDDIAQSHVVDFIKDIRNQLSNLRDAHVQLPNSVAMPEVSSSAAEQKLNKINMKDFFVKVFNDETRDPTSEIYSLEPLLEHSHFANLEQNARKRNDPTLNASSDAMDVDQPLELEGELLEMSEFLGSSSLPLRLSLWKRLRESYELVEYYPKVVSCYLRRIELLANELSASNYVDSTQEHRLDLLLQWLRMVDYSCIKILTMKKSRLDAFESIDGPHLKTSINSLTTICKVIQAFNLHGDRVRLKKMQEPSENGRTTNYYKLTGMINDLQIRVWLVLYALIREGMEQDAEKFPTPAETRFECLQGIHTALGIRALCNGAANTLLKFMRDELLELSDVSRADVELCQVLNDLYGLDLFDDANDIVDHGCEATIEPLSKKSALKILGFVQAQAHKVPLKDLPKTEMRLSIDKVHNSLGRMKTCYNLDMNRRLIQKFLKSPITLGDLLKAYKGTLELSTMPVAETAAPIAAKGWYFLMGCISLQKFRSPKRTGAGSTEDIDVAITFFLPDLEYCSEQWESWYRLAQTYDLELEECVCWTADKLNSQHHHINTYQRNAINCYLMAISCVKRFGVENLSEKIRKKVSKLYSDFGNRIYSSSREPFSMTVFDIKDAERRHYNSLEGGSMYHGPPGSLVQVHHAWKYAAQLFKAAISINPNEWTNHYMLGKCLWKLWSRRKRGDLQEDQRKLDLLIGCFCSAVQHAPRDSRKDPVLEPHYKILSIVHKVVMARVPESGHRYMSPERGHEILQITPYAKNIGEVVDDDTWEEYILGVLKRLRSADKSNWHHRMTARAATVNIESSSDMFGAMGAKHELTQQMFTKTMSLQVWKPDNERPGRHFVYTTRYVRFFIDLLDRTDDRISFENLTKRVRRKPQDFFEHTKLWQDVCMTFLKVLRRVGNVLPGHEDAIFKSLTFDEFDANAKLLQNWAYTTEDCGTAYAILREVVELKKQNNGLMKQTLIDDLLCDSYAALYDSTVPRLLEQARHQPKLAEPGSSINLRVGSSANTPTPSSAAADLISRSLQSSTPEPGIVHTTRPYKPKSVGRRELQRRAELIVVGRPSNLQQQVSSPTLGGSVVAVPGSTRSVASGPGCESTRQGVEGTNGKEGTRQIVEVVISPLKAKARVADDRYGMGGTDDSEAVVVKEDSDADVRARLPPPAKTTSTGRTSTIQLADDESGSELSELEDEDPEAPEEVKAAIISERRRSEAMRGPGRIESGWAAADTKMSGVRSEEDKGTEEADEGDEAEEVEEADEDEIELEDEQEQEEFLDAEETLDGDDDEGDGMEESVGVGDLDEGAEADVEMEDADVDGEESQLSSSLVGRRRRSAGVTL